MISTMTEFTERLAPVMLSLLGGFDLTVHNNRAPIQGGSKVEALMTHLALARQQPLQRTELLERLWPEQDPALSGTSLNSLVYQINKFVRKSTKCQTIIVHDNGYYHLNTARGVGIDIAYFETWGVQGQNLLAQGEADRGLAYCEQALALYRGDLVGDTSIQTVMERESLRIKFLDLLAAMADCHADTEPAQALAYIRRLLTHDPCREDAHRLAMRCYMRLHARTKALRQFQLCRQALKVEFDAEPEPETIALFDQIRLDPASV